MRTDVKVRTSGKLRCPEIPLYSPGRPHECGRGDYIAWQWDSTTNPDSMKFMGRIIGIVRSPDDGKRYFVTATILLGGLVCERWVLPSDVYDTRASSPSFSFRNKAAWMHSDEFMTTPTDIARQAFDRVSMMEGGAR